MWQTFSSWWLKSRCSTEERIFLADSRVLGWLSAVSKDAVKISKSKGSTVIPESGLRTSCPPLFLEETTKSPIAKASTVTLAKGS